MFGPTKIYFLLFGLLTIAGGVIGCVKAGSTASLVAGSVSGLLLLAAGFLLPARPTAALLLGGIVSLLLIGYFLPKFFASGKLMPAGMMAVLSFIGVVFALAAWIRK
jgi:uncharacterized membrane protein (UPF0136 family)